MIRRFIFAAMFALLPALAWGQLGPSPGNLTTPQPTDLVPLYGRGTTGPLFGQVGQLLNGGIDSIVVGPAQSVFGQIGEFTAAYPGLLTSADVVRVQVGGFPITDEFYGSGAVKGVQALVGAIRTPSGATGDCGGVPCADYAVAGYAQTDNTGRAAVGVFGEGGIMVNGALAEGANFVVVNCENHNAACVPGSAFNFSPALYVVEADLVIYDTPSGAATGNASAFIAILNNSGSHQNTGALNAYSVETVGHGIGGGGIFKIAYSADNGSATVGLSLGAQGTANSSDGQVINLTSISSGGMVQLSTIQELALGILQFNNNVAGSQFNLEPSSPQWTFITNSPSGGTIAKINNLATGGSAIAGWIIQTGSTNSYATLEVTDANAFAITTGAGLADIQYVTPINIFATGATNNAILAAGSGAATFNVFSLNGAYTLAGAAGIYGGADTTNLYMNVPTGGTIHARVNGSDVWTTTGSGTQFSGILTAPDSGTWSSGGINGSVIGATTPEAITGTTVRANTGFSANGAAGVSTTCTVTATNTYVFTDGLLTTKGANCT